MDINVVIAEYKQHMQVVGYARRTIELYVWGLDGFKTHLKEQGITDLRQVSSRIVTDYQAFVATQAFAMETRAIKLRSVKRLFEYLSESNRLLINPTEAVVETCRVSRKIGAVLSIDEMKKVMQQPNLSLRTGIRDRTIMEVFYSTGIRAGELQGLEVYHVDLRDGVLYIRKAKGKRQRVTPLGKTAAKYLKEYLEKVRPHWAKKNPKERKVFLNSAGMPITWNNVRTNIYVHAQKAGIKKGASPHTFRRSCATHLLQQGADIRYVQQLLGHKYLKTTQQYTKVIPIDIKQTHKETHPNENKKSDP